MAALRFTLGVDIGGTFTDCVALASDGSVGSAKVLTQRADRAASFFGSIEAVAETLGLSLAELLARCDRLVHGTTTGTNAIVARHGARVGLITTAGHGDIMFLMKGGGRTAGLPAERLLDIASSAKPPPIVERGLIREATQRTDLDGDEVVALDEAGARQAILELIGKGAEAIAISFLWSVKNPAAEMRVLDLVRELAPDAFVCRASELSTRIGEYERTTLAVVNAYIGPLMLRYVDDIESGSAKQGYQNRILYAQCAGGAITGDEARAVPIRTLQSGPVSGIVGSVFLGKQIGYHNILAADMGGTTFDVSVIRDGKPLARTVSTIERYELALPMLDVESIGAGGGSIAAIDASGRMTVGPRSATAEPGPACYGRGGTEATVTDADLVLGLISPEGFFGGRMTLDREAAERAIGALASRLGLSLLETAAGVTRIVDAKMSDLIRRMSVLRGFDPRDFVCFAFGGGGPVHAGAVCADIGVGKVIVPLLDIAPVWSAFGAATADVSHLYAEQARLPLPAPPHALDEIFKRLEARALASLRQEGFTDGGVSLERTVRMKYATQIHDVEVPAPGGPMDAAAIAVLSDDFERIYRKTFGAIAARAGAPIEITGVEVRANGLTYKPSLRGRRLRADDVLWTSRQVYWPELGESVGTPVLQMKSGLIKEPLLGPALIELPYSVCVVKPGQTADSDDFGNLVIHL
jgi:N-methylhydantoinase A